MLCNGNDSMLIFYLLLSVLVICLFHFPFDDYSGSKENFQLKHKTWRKITDQMNYADHNYFPSCCFDYIMTNT